MPSPRVGFVGAGQLARMSLAPAIELGIDLRLLADRADDAAARVWPAVTIGSATDPQALQTFAAACDVTTFDHELVDVPTLEAIAAAGHAVHPSPAVMRLAQDKEQQRRLFADTGLPNPEWKVAKTLADVLDFGSLAGWPLVIKAIRGGYDGRGVWQLDNAAAAEQLLPNLLAAGTPLLVEAFVPIERELAVMVARNLSGEVRTYPVVESVQIGGICREVIAPAEIDEQVARQARQIAHTIAGRVELTGVMAVELFLSGDRLTINELATRPHNSGHWTIEGADTSQFAQHLRAVLDWPLGGTGKLAKQAVMVNLIGSPGGGPDPDRIAAALTIPGVNLHWYGKGVRPGRKVGHVTLLGDGLEQLRERAWQAIECLGGANREERW